MTNYWIEGMPPRDQWVTLGAYRKSYDPETKELLLGFPQVDENNQPEVDENNVPLEEMTSTIPIGQYINLIRTQRDTADEQQSIIDAFLTPQEIADLDS